MRRAILLTLLAFVLLGTGACMGPTAFRTLRGGRTIYPDVILGKPAILAFLSANDRRCDAHIKSLWSIGNRPGNPAQILGVMVYDDSSFVDQIDTLNYATYTIIMDPEKRLAGSFWVKSYPTFIFLDWEGDEVDRSTDVKEIAMWVDDPESYEEALPPPAEQRPAP